MVLGDEMTESCDDHAFLLFGRAVGLRVIRHSCQLFNTKVAAHGSEELTDKLRFVIPEKVAWDAKGNDPLFEKDDRHVR